MPKYLYKYLPFRNDFFQEPMIRATPHYALNDPHECHFNKLQIKNANKFIDSYYKANENILLQNGLKLNTNKDDIDFDEIMADGVFDDLRDVGIISFTEEPFNYNMWSHYADDHKGIVVEFEQNIPFFQDSIKDLKDKKSRFGEDYLGQIFEFPEKVMYEENPPTFENDKKILPDSLYGYHFKNFNKTILFTKSKNWENEAEHRSVVLLKDADRIICEDDEYIRRICNENPEIDLIQLNNGRIQITYPREYEMNEEMGDESVKDEIYRLSSLGYNSNAIHLFRINPHCISRIYLGTNFKQDIIDYKKVYEHVRFEQLYKDDYSFSLKVKK